MKVIPAEISAYNESIDKIILSIAVMQGRINRMVENNKATIERRQKLIKNTNPLNKANRRTTG